MTKENPFTKKARRTPAKWPVGSKKTSGSRSRSTRKTPPRWQWIEVGMRLRVEWKYDPAYGTGTAVFVGEVVKINDWLYLRNRIGVRCEMPLSFFSKIEQVAKSDQHV